MHPPAEEPRDDHLPVSLITTRSWFIGKLDGLALTHWRQHVGNGAAGTAGAPALTRPHAARRAPQATQVEVLCPKDVRKRAKAHECSHQHTHIHVHTHTRTMLMCAFHNRTMLMCGSTARASSHCVTKVGVWTHTYTGIRTYTQTYKEAYRGGLKHDTHTVVHTRKSIRTLI